MTDRSRSGRITDAGRGRAAVQQLRSAASKKTAAKKTAIKQIAAKTAARRKTGVKKTGVKKTTAKRPAPAVKPLPLKVDILIEAAGWLKALAITDEAVLTRRLRAAARRAVAIAQADRWKGSSAGLECCLVLSSDAQVKRLNKAYRGKDRPTNVLSFAALDGGMPPKREIWPLGDIILALGVCRQEAKAQKKSLEQHLMHLVIHGVLHLLGYDHEMDDQADHMEGLEIAALKRLGIGNPYLAM